MRRAAVILFVLLPALAACATTERGKPAAVTAVIADQPEWAGVATPADQTRLDALPALFAKAVAAVPRNRAGLVTAESALVDPTAAQLLPELPPGPYYCRLVRFGGRARFATYKPDFCYVEVGQKDKPGGNLSFTKQTGSNLPEGWIYPDGERRQVFLGAVRRTGERGVRRYGDDPAHDLAGVIERVSPFRWRLILTRAGNGAMLDIYELVPVPPQVPGAQPAVPQKS